MHNHFKCESLNDPEATKASAAKQKAGHKNSLSLSMYIYVYMCVRVCVLQVWWAASDLGWVVGHSYICYGPLLHGNSTILYEVRHTRSLLNGVRSAPLGSTCMYD